MAVAEKGTTWIRPGQEVRINGWDQWVINRIYWGEITHLLTI